MLIREIGCCGAYCKTCPALRDGSCRSCKLGYETGEREINRAKCAMKVCCFKERAYETCADCPDYSSCGIIQGFYNKKGYKYKKYKHSLDFVRKNGYDNFLQRADNWKGPFGKLD
ncbi:MAG: DUF3795 domain-containing protein [Methanophagales archaeon ANME-1-THS]|nr:MAG: DUF3795 domain-containing protein [Methanophagales archaeon ANME-1-THS]